MGIRDEARAFVAGLIAQALVRDADEPHVVILTDPETGAIEVFGPYPDAYEAAGVAVALLRYHAEKTGPPEMRVALGMFFGRWDGPV